MEVILTQDVKGLGKKNQLIKASDGYARNYLLPKGIAIEATKANVNEMNSKAEAQRAREARERAKALEQQQQLSSLELNMTAKGGSQGKLFGSLTTKEISEALKSQHGIDIDRKKMELDEPIKGAGTYHVGVKLYPQITARITVNVKVEA